MVHSTMPIKGKIYSTVERTIFQHIQYDAIRYAGVTLAYIITNLLTNEVTVVGVFPGA